LKQKTAKRAILKSEVLNVLNYKGKPFPKFTLFACEKEEILRKPVWVQACRFFLGIYLRLQDEKRSIKT